MATGLTPVTSVAPTVKRKEKLDNELITDPIFKRMQALKKILNKFNRKTFKGQFEGGQGGKGEEERDDEEEKWDIGANLDLNNNNDININNNNLNGDDNKGETPNNANDLNDANSKEK